MLISFIVYIKNHDYKGQINRILKRIKPMNYPKKNIEILIYAESAGAKQVYRIPGPPLIRILPGEMDPARFKAVKPTSLNTMIKECHGNIIYLIDERFKFPVHFLKGKSTSRIYIGNRYCQVLRSFRYADDVGCYRTASIMQAVLSRRKMHGSWGRLNRQEILRILYRWDEISLTNRVKIIWGWINGTG